MPIVLIIPEPLASVPLVLPSAEPSSIPTPESVFHSRGGNNYSLRRLAKNYGSYNRP